VRTRATVELVVAVTAAAGSVLSWLGARSTVAVAPLLPGESETVSVLYNPPWLVLSMVLAAAAGVLLVLAIARLRRSPAPSRETPFPVAHRAVTQP
jgi:hypothetical protein